MSDLHDLDHVQCPGNGPHGRAPAPEYQYQGRIWRIWHPQWPVFLTDVPRCHESVLVIAALAEDQHAQLWQWSAVRDAWVSYGPAHPLGAAFVAGRNVDQRVAALIDRTRPWLAGHLRRSRRNLTRQAETLLRGDCLIRPDGSHDPVLSVARELPGYVTITTARTGPGLSAAGTSVAVA